MFNYINVLLFSDILIISYMQLFAIAIPIFISSNYHKPTEGSLYKIPQEGQSVTFNCSTTNQRKALFWILPNGTRIDVPTTTIHNNNINKNNINNNNNNYNTNNDSLIRWNVSENQLILYEVHKGMDGQYICVLEDSQKQIFFIPYVVSAINFTQAVLISLCVTIAFAIACTLVLLFDRYCTLGFRLRRRRVAAAAAAAQVGDQSPTMPVRKQRTMSIQDVDLQNNCYIDNYDYEDCDDDDNDNDNDHYNNNDNNNNNDDDGSNISDINSENHIPQLASNTVATVVQAIRH